MPDTLRATRGIYNFRPSNHLAGQTSRPTGKGEHKRQTRPYPIHEPVGGSFFETGSGGGWLAVPRVPEANKYAYRVRGGQRATAPKSRLERRRCSHSRGTHTTTARRYEGRCNSRRGESCERPAATRNVAGDRFSARAAATVIIVSKRSLWAELERNAARATLTQSNSLHGRGL